MRRARPSYLLIKAKLTNNLGLLFSTFPHLKMRKARPSHVPANQGKSCVVSVHQVKSTHLHAYLTTSYLLWYKYYSGGWCTWPTPLKYPESKSKSNEA